MHPLIAGPIGIAQPRTLIHYGAPPSLYVIAVGLPGAYVSIPGFENVLTLNGPVIIDSGSW